MADRLRSRRIVSTLLVGAALACGPAPLPEPPPNLVILVLDSVRAERLSCYGHPVVTTPNLDAMARTGARFDAAYTASPQASSSLASLLSGALPFRAELAPGASLPELLAASGRRTAAFIGGSSASRGRSLERGFEVFGEDPAASAAEGPRDPRTVEATLDLAIARLEQVGEPFALLVHFPDLQDAAQLSPEHYDEKLASLDRQIGRLMARLEHGRTIDRTLFVVVGACGLERAGAPREGGALSEAHLRVPLIVRGPGLPRGRAVADRVRLVDVAPTLVELLRLRAPEQELDGSSFAQMLRMPRKAPEERREVYAEARDDAGTLQRRALCAGRWKYIEHSTGAAHELYDLHADALEARNLFTPEHPVARLLAARLAALTSGGAGPAPLTARERALLESTDAY